MMIMIDVEVPVLDRIYDFELDTEVLAEEATGKIVTLILQNDGLTMRQPERFYLYGLRQEKVLNPDMTLKEQGVQSGDRLVLI